MRTSGKLQTVPAGIPRHAAPMNRADRAFVIRRSRQEDEQMTFAEMNLKMKFAVFLLLFFALLPARSLWAQVDITGEWSPRIYNDGRDVGDYTGIPLNEAGRMRAESFHPEQFDLPENICRPHAFDIGLRVAPAQLYISTELDSATQQVVAYHFHAYWSDFRVWMDGRPRPPEYAAHKFSGFSTGKWMGNSLVFTTDHLKAGFITRVGVPRI